MMSSTSVLLTVCAATGTLEMLVGAVAHARPDADSRQPGYEAGLDCDRPEPPTSDYDYELGFADASLPDSEVRATEAAIVQLRRRYCGDRLDCSGLVAGVKRWRAGLVRGQRCVMVTVLKSHQRDWLVRTTSVEPLDAAIREGARRLFAQIERRRGAPNPTRRKPSAVVGAIEDGGTIGGPRALWVANRVEQALSDAGFRVLDLSFRSRGKRAGGQYDVMVTGHMLERAEGTSDILEVALRATSGDERIPLPPASCGLGAVKSMTRHEKVRPLGKRSRPFTDASLVLTIDAGRGGKLCEGETTQIKLSTDTTMHLRVFNIYGRDKGMLIFPNEAEPDDKVVANRALSLGGDGEFEIILMPGSSEERFIVLASEEPDGLGPWQGLRGTCKLQPELISYLLDVEAGDLPAGMRATESGYRITHEGCAAPPPSEAVRRRLSEALEAVPACELERARK